MEEKIDILNSLLNKINLPNKLYIKIKAEYLYGINEINYLNKNYIYKDNKRYNLIITIFAIAVIYKYILAPMISISEFKYSINLGKERISKEDIKKFKYLKISFEHILLSNGISIYDLNYSDFSFFVNNIYRKL